MRGRKDLPQKSKSKNEEELMGKKAIFEGDSKKKGRFFQKVSIDLP